MNVKLDLYYITKPTKNVANFKIQDWIIIACVSEMF